MYTINLECAGMRPFLYDPKTAEIKKVIRGDSAKAASPKITGETMKEEAEKKLIRENGNLVFPSLYLMMCLMNAGKGKEYKKELGLPSTDGSFVTSLIAIDEEFIVMAGSKKWVVDERAVPTKTGASQVKVRPKLPEWGFKVTLVVDDSLRSAIVRRLVDQAGRLIGVGSGRKIGFGKFKVTGWEAVDERPHVPEEEEKEGEGEEQLKH